MKYHAASGLRRAKCDKRVLDRGLSIIQSEKRTKLMVAAVAICCNLVLANPLYRVRRSPKAPVPCDIVPSTPARFAYSSQNPSVFCH
jgi:hypothetical protein